MWFRAILLALFVSSGATLAEETSLRALTTSDESRGWEAVGRLDIGRDGFCTGALVAADLVLTAAHCLFDPESGERLRPEAFTFLAGWRDGVALAYRRVIASATLPAYRYSGPSGNDHVADDIALLRLDREIRNGRVMPFETGARPRKGARVGVVSYAHDRARRPAIEEGCTVLGRPQGTLVLTCDADFGSSGAPIFMTGEDGSPRIVSVISAKAMIRDRRVSIGTGLAGKLNRLAAIIEAEGAAGAPRMLRSSEESGAKFLRP